MKKFLLLLLILSAVFHEVCGEVMSTDTIFRLREVRVVANAMQQGTNVGTRTSMIPTTVLEGNKTRSLSELLSENSLVYIKSLGQGGLSTSSFRGTSSSHTQVNWNGVTINPATGGSFDFSQFPAFFADEVSLYHGSSAQNNGSGALGGSIHLNNRPTWNSGEVAKLLFEYGSNDTYSGALVFKIKGDRFLSNTRLFYKQSANDFLYLNKVLQKDPFYERRKEAEYSQMGAMQEFYYKLHSTGVLSANIWFQKNNNQLPQPVIVNKKQHETQKTENWRSVVAYTGSKEAHEYKISAAFMSDKLAYKRWFDDGYVGNNDENKMNTFQLRGEYTHHFANQLDWSTVFSYRLDAARSDNYEQKPNRNTIMLQTSGNWSLMDRLQVNLQLTGESNNRVLMPTFTAGCSYIVLPQWLSIKGTASYNYHQPTLNDLYWQPGGNPNLRPEKGFSYDLTFMGNKRWNRFSIKYDLSYYLMNINDWIVWLPTEQTYLWSPKNIQQVLSHGAETTIDMAFTHNGFWKHRLMGGYGYSPAVNRSKNYEKDESVNKQLPYIPLHKWNARYVLAVRHWEMNYHIAFTDKRFTSTDESYVTTAFCIHNFETSYRFLFRERHSLTARCRVENLFNSYYESTEFYPMPLRSFYLSVMYIF